MPARAGKVARPAAATEGSDPDRSRTFEGRPPMLLIATLLVLAAEPTAPTPSPSPAEVERLEARHLKNIRQVTSGFSKAGEGYFRPDGQAIIFQAAQPGEDDYQIYTLDLAPGSKPRMVSTGKGK